MSTQLDAAAIARVCLHDPTNFSIQHSQTIHRLVLLQQWNVPADSKVLELGCGQGDCTTVLASAVGEQGRVVAVDPAALDYGAPYTLGQAQSHISQGPLGSRITWVQRPPWTASPLFPPPLPAKIRPSTQQCSPTAYGISPPLSSSFPPSVPSSSTAALECRKPNSDSNVRTVLGPKRLTELALAAGWQLESETRVPGGEGLLDGQWEVSTCLSSSFEQEVEEQVSDERERAVILALRDACESSLEGIQGGRKGVKAMDVWVASFI
ncbi:uncharacterized protein N7496_011075 [Penicillium cataractarum]|uniref:Methyltransferase domain-containing protein n=1 Tax=Penicillium cataractarum TaxID=2100454 RepID=A0A9W9UV91_9EURO|nr:uncharacterized protein N7496_011075 [Penicillium cataractarum]KAJ5358662.1 hypothetical protein N7496_011075 [Penicillium cataractarum]